MNTAEKGRRSEELAAEWLVGQGFKIVARNHMAKRGEVDLVCREGDTLCFVEVRSRRSDRFGSAGATVNRHKARRVVAAATDWAMRNGGLDRRIRFDIVGVDLSATQPRLELHRGAFDADGESIPW
jgi:putative endonuclease